MRLQDVLTVLFLTTIFAPHAQAGSTIDTVLAEVPALSVKILVPVYEPVFPPAPAGTEAANLVREILAAKNIRTGLSKIQLLVQISTRVRGDMSAIAVNVELREPSTLKMREAQLPAIVTSWRVQRLAIVPIVSARETAMELLSDSVTEFAEKVVQARLAKPHDK